MPGSAPLLKEPSQSLYWDQPPPSSILILKPSSLGDVVHTLPSVAALKRHWPECKIRWMVNPEWAPLLQGNPFLDEVLLFPRSSFRGLGGPLRLLLWANQFGKTAAAELVLDFQCLLRSAVIGKFCRRAVFYGLSDAREGARFFYDGMAKVHQNQHAVDRYLALVRALGVPIPDSLEWPLPHAEAPEGFRFEAPYVVLHPFSRGSGKSMTAQQITEFCESIAPVKVVVLGRSEEPVPDLPNVEDWLNQTTLAQLVTLMRRAAWVVSVDSGPMHIASALSSRLLSLHTWSDPKRVGPYNPDAWVWKKGVIFQQKAPFETFPVTGAGDAALWVQQKL